MTDQAQPQEPASPEPKRRRRRWAFKLCALSLSLLVTLFLLEGVVRLVAPQRMGLPGLEPVGGILVPRANLRGRDYSPGDFDVEVTTNSMRLRGSREFPLEPNPGTRRILVLGDSFTYGVGAADADTYPARLEGLLSAQGAECEVLNAGIYGSGTGEQVLYYERWASQFRPAIVVLTLYANDLHDDQLRPAFVLEGDQIRPRLEEDLNQQSSRQNAARNLTERIPGYTYLAQHSHLLNLARGKVSALLRKPHRPAPSPAASPSPGGSPGPQEDAQVASRLLELQLARLKEKVEADGGRLAIVFVPPRHAVRKTGDPSEFQAFVAQARDAARRLALPFRDLTPGLAEAAGAGGPLYFEGDPHCTPAGYLKVAEGVADFLQAEGLIPPAK